MKKLFLILAALALLAPAGVRAEGDTYIFETYGDDFGLVVMHYNGKKGAEDLALRNEFTDYAKKIMARSMELERIHGR